MKENYPSLNQEEKLRADNEFLKMKLMLERGAEFTGISGQSLPPQLENQFLRNIIEFEKQSDDQGYIKLFEKLGRPAQFKSVNEIKDNEIEAAWEELSSFLYQHSISLGVCSPRVSRRELYRFVTEELFQQDIIGASIPGMMHGFIYDEFYPDPIYDNTCAAVNDCIQHMLNADVFEWMHHFRDSGLRLNEHFPLTREQFKMLVNQFKKAYDSVDNMEITDVHCTVGENASYVKGRYALKLLLQNELIHFSGEWMVEFELDDKWGYWYIIHVKIEGIRF
jgi:hypothetical protein